MQGFFNMPSYKLGNTNVRPFQKYTFFFFSPGITLLKTSYGERILKVEFLAGVYDCVTFISSKRQLGSDTMHKRTVYRLLMSTGI